MSAPRLPEHLELLLTDEPVLDVYAYGPWRVPDGLYEELRDRALAANRDERAGRLSRTLHDFYTPETSVVGAELWSLLTFLLGASAVRGGSRGDVDYELLSDFLANPEPAVRDPLTSFSQGGRYRPPGLWLPEPAGDDRDKRGLMYELARECLDVFAGLRPVERRRRALIELFDRRAADPDARERDLAEPLDRVEQAWAEDVAGDDLAVLPELAGPVGYLEWACAGFIAAHERLVAAAPEGDPLDLALARLLLQAEIGRQPAELAVCLGVTGYEAVEDRMHRLRTGYSVDAWVGDVRGWLARCLVAGEADACRAWIDMAVRITGAVQGLPERAANPRCRVPVRAFQADLRRLYAPRRAVNPLVSRFAPADRRPEAAGGADDADNAAGSAGSAGGSAAGAAAEEEAARPDGPLDDLVGQPELVAALRAAVAARGAAGQPVRLLIAGPEGTGRGVAVEALERALIQDGAIREALWISDQVFPTLPVSDAVLWLQARLRDCLEHRLLLVVDDLERLLGYERCGSAVIEELRRVIARSPKLEVVALCRPGGDQRLLEANPALLRALRVVRTRDFREEDFAELFAGAVARLGGSAAREVAAAAGGLLARTPPVLNLRGARLVEHVAQQCVEVAARRAGRQRAAAVEVTVADLPGAADALDPQAELAGMVGIEPVKREIQLLLAEAKAARLRRDAGMAVADPPRHLVFTGNRGTGKSRVARLLGRSYADLEVLETGHLVEVERADLVGEYASESGPRVRRAVDRALGGVLFVDNAHALNPADSPRDREVLDMLLSAARTHRGNLVVVLAGPDAEINGLLNADADVAEAFPKVVRFPDLSGDDLVTVFERRAAADGFALAAGVLDAVRALVRDAARDRGFTNARLMIGLLQRAVANQGRRVLEDGIVDEDENLHEILVPDVPGQLVALPNIELPGDPLAEVDRLIGLETVKDEVRLLVDEARAERERRRMGIPSPSPTRHMMFTGNPGTAKTTIARLLAAVYAKLELLSTGHLVEVSRPELVAEFIGQTAPKVRRAVERALGGVLFIDEAYSLTASDDQRDFGHEAVAELLRLMEEHRRDLVVIVAGYEAEMRRFRTSNSGLASRFSRVLHFPDYSDDELLAIFESMAAKAGFTLAEGVHAEVRSRAAKAPRDSSFGNARHMRNLLERAVALQARRITSAGDGRVDAAEIPLLRPEDLPPREPVTPERDLPGFYP